MNRSSAPRRFWLGAVLPAAAMASFLLVSPPARAALDPGAEAPDVTAQKFFNTEPLSIAQLKGRVVMLELFSTT